LLEAQFKAADNHPMQPSGEVGRFDVENQPSPPADRNRYPNLAVEPTQPIRMCFTRFMQVLLQLVYSAAVFRKLRDSQAEEIIACPFCYLLQ